MAPLLAAAAMIAATPVRARTEATPPAAAPVTGPDTGEGARINDWTVGLAAGQLGGSPLRFATEIAHVVDDGNRLRAVPIVTGGPTSNIEALLYLKGVDLAIIDADALEAYRTRHPGVAQRIAYILNLFPAEMQVFARPGIRSLADLNGRTVNFNTPGTAAAYSGPLIFDKLGLAVHETFIPQQVALAQMRAGKGDIAAVVCVTAKPAAAFRDRPWPPGFGFLAVPYRDFHLYLPARLTADDYPGLIPAGRHIQTIAVPTILAAFNWPPGSNRYARVARFTGRLFSRISMLQRPGFDAQWKDVVLNAQVPGLHRFRAAQDWLDSTAPRPITDASKAAGAPSGSIVLTPADARLFQQFLEWRRRNGQ